MVLQVVLYNLKLVETLSKFTKAAKITLPYGINYSVLKGFPALKAKIPYPHRAELYDTTRIFKGARALNLKDRGDKWHDTIKKMAAIGKGRPAFNFFTALLCKI